MATHPRQISSIILAVLIGAGLLVAGCGDDLETGQAGAKWLTDNHQAPEKSGWKMGAVRADGDGVHVIMKLDSVSKERHLNGLSAMDKGNVARLGCPAFETEFWEIVGASATVDVTLTSMGKKLVQAVCRRPR